MKKDRICPVCGTPQQWEMWRYCACGYDFGPPAPDSEVEASEPGGGTETPSSLEQISPEQLIRSVRIRIVGIWAALLGGSALSYLFVSRFHWPATSANMLFFWPLVLIAQRLRNKAPELPSVSLTGAIVICSAALALLVASVSLPPRSLDYILPLVIAVFLVSLLIGDIRVFRTPLRFIAAGDRDPHQHA